MKKIVYEFLGEYWLFALFFGVIISVINGARTLREYFKQVLITGVVIVPIGLILEYAQIDILLKYAVITAAAPISIRLYNGLQKAGKQFEEDPLDFIKKVKGVTNDNIKRD